MGTVLFDRKVLSVLDLTPVSGSIYTNDLNIETCEHLCFMIQNDPQTLVNIEFNSSNVVGGKIFAFPHPYTTGLKVRFTTTGTLPTGLAVDTDYWLTNVNGFGFEVASSLSNAEQGVSINISGGSGDHEVVPSTFTKLNCKVEVAIENGIWAEISNSQMVSTKQENFIYELNSPVYKFIRIKNWVESGQTNLIIKVLMKGHGY